MTIRILIVIILCFFSFQHSYSQILRIAVFDLDSMVHELPEYKAVDSLVNIFADSAMVEYQSLKDEYAKLNNILFSHIRNMRLLDSVSKRRQEVTFALIYWKPNIEQKTRERIREWSKPLYERVNMAFNKVIANKNFDIILKPSYVEIGSNVENLFIAVARELHLRSLPNNLFYSETLSIH